MVKSQKKLLQFIHIEFIIITGRKMLKRIYFVLIALLFCISMTYTENINVQEIVDSYNEYGIIITLPDTHIIVDQIEQYDAKYDFAFKVKSQNVEYRISYVSDKFEDFKKNGMTNEEIINFILVPTAANISQQFSSPTSFNPFPKEAVKREFNTEFGLTALVQGNSMFSGEWTYVMIDGFYKENIGFIIRYSLFDDLEEFTKNDKDSYEAYHVFRFK